MFPFPAIFNNSDAVKGPYHGKNCTVLRELTDIECDKECQPMYLVRFAGGFTCHAYPDELTFPSSQS